MLPESVPDIEAPPAMRAKTRVRCLWIGRYIPYPMDAGAKVYSAQLAQSLADTGVEVRFLGIGGLEAIPESAAKVHWVAVAGGKRGEIAALFSALPNAAATDATGAYSIALENHLLQSWDFIVFDGYGTGWALGRCLAHCKQRGADRPALVHVSHNHEEKLWRSMAGEAHGSFLRRLGLWQNYHKVRALERRLIRGMDLLTTITDEDRQALGGLLPDSKVLTLTPGYEGWTAAKRRIGVDTPRRVIVIGSFRWIVKQENLARLVELADVSFQRHSIELDVVGDVPEELLARLKARCRATRFHGFVQDVAPLMAEARIAVVPEAIGGGFKLKFLDYFFGRVPVATLRRAAAGLPAELRRQTLTCESLPELVETIVSHIDRFEQLNRLQEQAFAHSRALFTWQERGETLRRAMIRNRYG